MEYLKSLKWASKNKIKKEFIITIVSTIVITISVVIINLLATSIFGLFN